jgi:predicted membrane protein
MDADRWEEKRQRWEERREEKRQRWEDRQEERRQRWALRAARRPNRPGSHGIFFGAIIVAVGCMLLLDNLGIFRFRDIWQYWPVLLIIWGASHVINSRAASGWIWGGMITLVGAFFLLDTLDIIAFSFQTLWPVLLIAFGLSVLVGAVERTRYRAGVPEQPGAPMVETNAVFSDNKTGSDTKEFQGGRASAIFGVARFDLRNATMSGDEARIHVDVVFGEAEVRVPENWHVISRAAVVFGAVNDKTIHPRPDPNLKMPRLVITGSVVFGAITLRN